jgi:hypothetical protein
LSRWKITHIGHFGSVRSEKRRGLFLASLARFDDDRLIADDRRSMALFFQLLYPPRGLAGEKKSTA